ncbi:hypothetical protein DFJ74DRAFT_100994 [Hyaloraphidium curvatum]|nr:hypothetical protein DFJ74DRAFT_100994 [Hyaloraphidium curvatum]
MADKPNPRWKVRPQDSTWGDWGPDDQIGRLNLINEQTVLAAAKEIRDGRRFCLSLPLDRPGGEVLSPGRPPPKLSPTEYVKGMPQFNQPLVTLGQNFCDVGCDDRVDLVLQHSTQWDSLAHIGSVFDKDGTGKPVICYYNGYSAEDMVSSGIYHPDGKYEDAHREHKGATKLGIENIAATPVQGRGVLIDLERRYGRERHRVSWKELEQIMKEDNIVVESGDMVLFYTGYGDVVMEQGDNPDKSVLLSSCAVIDGLDPGIQQFFIKNGIVAAISDNYAVEAFPEPNVPADPSKPHPLLPLHEVLLFKLGAYIGELWWLTDLAMHLRETKRSRFFLTAPPLRLPGAVGSPANAVATT